MSTQENFNYQGHLIFSPSLLQFNHDLERSNQQIMELVSSLPKYSSGTPSEPGYGYKEFNLNDYSAGFKLPNWLVDEVNDWVCLQYISEEYDEEEAYVGDDKEIVQIQSQRIADILIHNSGTVLFRGTKSMVAEAKNKFQRDARGQILLKDLRVRPDAFVSGSTAIKSDLIESVSFKSLDAYTDSVTVSGEIKNSDYLKDSLERGRVKSITGDFVFEDIRISATIGTNIIQIRVSSRDLQDEDDLTRFVVALAFSYAVCDEVAVLKGELKQ